MRIQSKVVKPKPITDEDWKDLFAKIYLTDFLYVQHGINCGWNASDRASCFQECIEYWGNDNDFLALQKKYTDQLNHDKRCYKLSGKYLRKRLDDMRNQHAACVLDYLKRKTVFGQCPNIIAERKAKRQRKAAR